MPLSNQFRSSAALPFALAVLLAGCKHSAPSGPNYADTLDGYYASRPVCLWPQPVKFPVQVATKDDGRTAGYDALYDQGLLQRTTGEKKEFIIMSKQVTNYDLTDKGRGSWTADASQPGFGNFCYGHRKVQSIDSSTPVSNVQPGATTQVSYHYNIAGVPGWASAPETQNAYPALKANLSGASTGAAVLVYQNNSWQVQPGSMNNDNGIVQ